MKRIVCLLIFIFSLLFFSVKILYAGYGISPPLVKNDHIKQGEHDSQKIIVLRSKTEADEEVAVSIDAPFIESWLEIRPGRTFVIPKGELNRSMYVDIKVPIDASPGNYQGKIIVKSEGSNNRNLPPAIIDIELTVIELSVESKRHYDLFQTLKGRILIEVEDLGKAWYINPQNDSMYYLGRPSDAFAIMRDQGIGITNTDLEKIPVNIENLSGIDSDNDGLPDLFEDAIGCDKYNTDTDGDGYSDKAELQGGYSPIAKLKKLDYNFNFVNNQRGKIFLQTEKNGEAWYVNPEDDKRYFLGRPSDAFNIMRNLGLGISDDDFGGMTSNYWLNMIKPEFET